MPLGFCLSERDWRNWRVIQSEIIELNLKQSSEVVSMEFKITKRKGWTWETKECSSDRFFFLLLLLLILLILLWSYFIFVGDRPTMKLWKNEKVKDNPNKTPLKKEDQQREKRKIKTGQSSVKNLKRNSFTQFQFQ